MRVVLRSTRHLDSRNSRSTLVLRSSISPRPKSVRTLALLNHLFSFEAENADALDDTEMSGDSKRVRLAARTTLTLFSRSPVCGVFWGTEMGWSLPGGGGRRRDFVAAGCCARGWPRPVCGSAGIIYDGVLGSCMRIRRGRPIECAAVESKMFSQPLPPPTSRQLQPSRA